MSDWSSFKNRYKKQKEEEASTQGASSVSNDRTNIYSNDTEDRLTAEKYRELKQNGGVSYNTDIVDSYFKQAENYYNGVSGQQQNPTYKGMDVHNTTYKSLKENQDYVRLYIDSLKGTDNYDKLLDMYNNTNNVLESTNKVANYLDQFSKNSADEGEFKRNINPYLASMGKGNIKQYDEEFTVPRSENEYYAQKYSGDVDAMQARYNELKNKYDKAESDVLGNEETSYEQKQSQNIELINSEESKEMDALGRAINAYNRGEEARKEKGASDRLNYKLEDKYNGFGYEDLISASKQTSNPSEREWLEDKAYDVATTQELQELYDSIQSEYDDESHAENNGVDTSNFGSLLNYVDDYQNKLKKIKSKITEKENNEIIAQYNALANEPDFNEHNTFDATKFDALSPFAYNEPYLRNNFESFATDEQRDDIARVIGDNKYAYMTNDEQQVYTYIYNTKGKEEAQKYLDALDSTINQRMTEDKVTEAYNFADGNGFLGSVDSLRYKFASGGGIIEDVWNNLRGESIDTNSPAHLNANIATAERTAVSENIDSDVGRWMYDTVMSGLDSAINIGVATALTGGVGALAEGAGMTISAEAMSSLTSAVSSTIMGSQVATQTVIDAKNRGLDDSQAVTLGLVYGAVEGITEKYSIESFLKNPTSIKSMLGKAFIAEGSEEITANHLDRIADALISGDKNEQLAQYNAYLDEGYTEQQALTMVIYNAIGDDASSFLAGGISGLAMSGTHAGVSKAIGTAEMYKENSNAGKTIKSVDENNVSELVKIGKDYDENSEVYKLASKIEQRIAENKKVSNNDVGKLQDAINKESIDSYNQVYKSVTENLSEDEKNIVDKLESGEELTNDEVKELRNNPVLKKAVNELNSVAESNSVKSAKALASSFVSIADVDNAKDIASVSSNGTTIVDGKEYTGNIAISKVDTKTNDVTIKLDDGTTAKLESVEFADKKTARLYSASAMFNTSTAQTFIDNYDGEMNVDEYAREFSLINHYGKLALPLTEQRKNIAYNLNDSQINNAYMSGLSTRKSSYQKQMAISQAAKSSKYYGFTQGKLDTSAIKGVKLNDDQKFAVQFGKVLSLMGINVELFESKANERGAYQGENGSFDKSRGVMRIDINGGLANVADKGVVRDGLLYTAGHEITHIAELAEGYDDFVDNVKRVYESKEGNNFELAIENEKQKLLKYIPEAKNWSEEELNKRAEYEAVAEACSSFLKDLDVFKDALSANPTFSKKLINTIKDILKAIDAWINDIKEWLKNTPHSAFNNVETAKNMIDALESQQEEYKALLKEFNSLVKEGIKISNAIALDESIKETDANAKETLFGTTDIEFSDSASVEHSIRDSVKISKAQTRYNKKNQTLNADILDKGQQAMLTMANVMRKYIDEETGKGIDGILPDDIKGKTKLKNGSYGWTMENTTICVRTLTYEHFKDMVAEKVGRPLTVSESLLVSQKIYDIAVEPQCIYCYVAADRKSYDEYVGEYIKSMMKYVEGVRNGENEEKLWNEWLTGKDGKLKKNTDNQQDRRKLWQEYANSDMTIDAIDFATRKLRENTKSKYNLAVKKNNPTRNKKYIRLTQDVEAYAQSASWAKKVQNYVAYNGEILKMNQKTVDNLNSEYGLRMYSFSDYTPAFITENMQMVTDASLKGLKVLSYTKDTDYAEIFADTGMAINVSCFAKWDSYLQTYVEDNRQGANWQKTIELRNSHSNVGAVMVATNDNMVEWALKQDWIDVVIPYHIVKTGTTIANSYDWKNYTRDSADYKDNKTANIYPTEHNNDFATFDSIIKERGITPRFSEWYNKIGKGITEEQYMKLINEVRLPASELSAVIPDFDIEAALRSFGVKSDGNGNALTNADGTHRLIKGGFVDKGGYYGGWYRDGYDVDAEVNNVSNDIESGKTVMDVDYGIQKIRDDYAKQFSMRDSYYKISVNGENISEQEHPFDFDTKEERDDFVDKHKSLLPNYNPNADDLYDFGDIDYNTYIKQTNATDIINRDYVRYERGKAKKITVAQFIDNIDDYRMADLISVAEQIGWSDDYSYFADDRKAFANEIKNAIKAYSENEDNPMDINREYVYVRPINNDVGKIIPLFSMRDGDGKSSREKLADALESNAKNNRERNVIKAYREGIASAEELSNKIDSLNNDIKEAEKSKAKNINILKTRRQNLIERLNAKDSQLLKLESMDSMRELIDRTVAIENEKRTKTHAGEVAELRRSYRDVTNKKLKKQAEHYEERISQIRGDKNDATAKKLKKQAEHYEERISQIRADKNDSTAKKLKQQAEHYEQRIAELVKEKNEAKDKAVKDRNKYYNDKLAELRQQRDKKLQELKDHNRRVNEAKRERRDTGKYIDRIKKLNAKLKQMATRPTDTSWCPAELIDNGFMQACISLTDALNSNNGSAISYELSNLSALYNSMQLNKNLPDELVGELDEEYAQRLMELADRLSAKLSNKNLKVKNSKNNGLTLADAEEVYDLVKGIVDTIADARKQINRADAITTIESGEKMINEFNALDKTKIAKTLAAFQSQTLNGIRAARMYTGYNEDSEVMYHIHAIEDGLGDADIIKMTAEKMLYAVTNKDKESRKAYRESLQEVIPITFTADNGEETTINITRMMGISMAMTWDREAYSGGKLSHMTKGSFILPDADLMRKGESQKAYSRVNTEHHYRANYSLISAVRDTFRDFELEYMDALRDVFDYVADEINHTSMLIKHRELAKDSHYFPYAVDGDFLVKELEDISTDYSLEGKGALKDVVRNSKKPIVIGSANDIVSKHIDDMSRYAGLAIPIRNFKKALNVKHAEYEIDTDELGNETKKEVSADTVRTAMEKAWGVEKTAKGDEAKNFFDQLIIDVQKPRSAELAKTSQGINKAINYIHQGSIITALTGNLSVIIKQAASYPTAALYLSAGDLTKAFAKGMKYGDMVNEIDEYTAVHYLRREGMSQEEIASMLNTKTGRLPTAINPTKWIQAVDCFTTAMLWSATKHHFNSEYRKSGRANEIGSEQYFNDVTKLYERIIYDTQPNYDNLHRPEIQKNQNSIVKSLFMYKTQPMQNSGILYDAMGELIAHPESKQAQRKAAKAVSSQICSALTFAVMGAIYGLLFFKPKKYQDEDGQVTPESIMRGILNDMLATFSGLIASIGGTEIYNFIQQMMDGYVYDTSIPIVDLLNDIGNTVQDAYDVVTDTVDRINMGYDADTDEIIDMLDEVGKLIAERGLHIPVGNMQNVKNAIVKWSQEISTAEDFADVFDYDTANANVKESDLAKSYINLYSKGNKDKATETLDRLYQSKLATEKSKKSEKGAEYGKKTPAQKAQEAVRNALMSSSLKEEFQKAFLKNDTAKMEQITNLLRDSGYCKWSDGKTTLSGKLGEWKKSAREDIDKKYAK